MISGFQTKKRRIFIEDDTKKSPKMCPALAAAGKMWNGSNSAPSSWAPVRDLGAAQGAGRLS